jgi:NDP-sugar pyrophosphorylase family protein
MQAKIKILVLAGGLGTRLRPLTDSLPKVLVPVLGRPFLEHVLEDLARQGFRRFVLSVGFLAEQIEDHFGDGARLGCQLEYVREDRPLGTGGAVRRALPVLGETFVVVNGDTLLELDLARLLSTHRREGQLLTLAAARVPDRGRYGALGVEGGRVVRFEEKQPGAGPGLVNGGVCAMNPALLDGAPAGPFSLERDWLPRHAGRIAVFETRGYFVDMGTHEALEGLDRELQRYLEQRGPTAGS